MDIEDDAMRKEEDPLKRDIEQFTGENVWRADPPLGEQGDNGQRQSGAEAAAEYERRRLLGGERVYYRTELSRFPELLDSRAVHIHGREFAGTMIDLYYERGELMSPYIVKDTIRRGREKPELLRDIMNTGTYAFTEEEERAGLKPREPDVVWLDRIPTEYIVGLSSGIIKIEEEEANGERVKYWKRKLNGGWEKVGRYGDNSGISPDLPEALREANKKPRIYVGVEIAGVSEADARRRREELAHSLERAVKYVEELESVFDKVNEQDIFAPSDEKYLRDRFLRIGKVIVRSKDYHGIFEADATREGFAPAGKKTQEALLGWIDLLQNKAVAELEIEDPDNPGSTFRIIRVMPNAHAYAMNEGLRDLNADYVKGRLEHRFNESPPEGANADDFRYVRDKDNKRAARLAVILVDHFDLDAANPFDIVWEKVAKVDKAGKPIRDSHGNVIYEMTTGADGRQVPKMKIKKIEYEAAYVDSAKLTQPTARRVKERFGELLDVVIGPDGKPLKDRRDPENRRSHPRVSGAPVTLLTLPELSSDFLNVTSVETLASNKADLEERDRNPDKFEREGKKVRQQKINVTIEQKAFGARDPKTGKRVLLEGGRSEVRRAREAGKISNEDVWVYEVTGLDDKRIWDEIQIPIEIGGELKFFSREDIKSINPVNTRDLSAKELMDRGAEKLDVAMGTTMNATEIPKGLLEFYAWAGIYSEFTRDDFQKQYDEYTDKDPARLKSISKQIQVSIGLLANAHQLSKDTTRKLEEYIRISLTAGCVASMVREKDGAKANQGILSEEQSQTHPISAVEYEGAMKGMKRRLLEAEFVRRAPGVDKQLELGWEDSTDEALFDFIVNNRARGPMSPWDLSSNGMPYFTEAQLKELKPLYSLLFLGEH